jgi:hypothetical protein
MMKTTRILALISASVLALAAAGAQDSLNLRGTVKSNSGNPIEGVEVRIEGSNLTTRSGRDGSFAFFNAPKGPQLLLFRLVGYLPTKEETRVPTKEPEEIMMLPTPHNLDTVRVVASLNVLAGVVVDAKDRPIPGATVEMLAGTSTTQMTDANGWFTFTSVKNGSVLVRARMLGYAPLTTSIRLEDWRGMVIHLEPLDSKFTGAKLEDLSGFSNQSKFVWQETQQRLAMRGMHAIVIPREELAPYDDYTLSDAILRTKTGAQETPDINSARGQFCVLLNGKNTVGNSTLSNFRTEEVEAVELYPPGTEMSGSVLRYMRSSGCRQVQAAGSFNRGNFYAVVWLR